MRRSNPDIRQYPKRSATSVRTMPAGLDAAPCRWGVHVRPRRWAPMGRPAAAAGPDEKCWGPMPDPKSEARRPYKTWAAAPDAGGRFDKGRCPGVGFFKLETAENAGGPSWPTGGKA